MATPEQIAIVNRYLPTAAKQTEAEGGYDWTDEYIETLMDSMAFGPAQAVRYFWYQRTQETAEYLDAGRPLSQIHRQAKEMLDYWDGILKTNPNGMEPPANVGSERVPMTFGDIERPWDDT
ncbi:head-to-tail stopper [Mycobacterium phage Indlulamithi]|uniref:Uncharacterized protein n=1 Tax=Mycobacterium phage Indlulamithi TaxID=2656582 RepID=A0A649VCL9_9CAUD|nr:head-to-tail stopper [Mycobacterium phage Indlulamithi]QGJ90056.1 hypothetical protein PBI_INDLULAMITHI_15 [Mycobacterium phage Indlulamithi]